MPRLKSSAGLRVRPEGDREGASARTWPRKWASLVLTRKSPGRSPGTRSLRKTFSFLPASNTIVCFYVRAHRALPTKHRAGEFAQPAEHSLGRVRTGAVVLVALPLNATVRR